MTIAAGSKRTVNVAMIGYDFMGRAHSNAWRQVQRFFTDLPVTPVMKVICGRTADKVAEAAAVLGWQEHATSWQAVVARPDIDIIDICTPGDSHLPIALAAAAAGKAILCEKPLANTVADAQSMWQAVKRAGVTHMLCHNYRRVPAVMLARQLIDEGKIGKIFHYRGTYLQDWIVDPGFPRVWRLEKSRAGSGALGDILSHTMDLSRFLVGEPVAVSSLLETFVRERPLPDGSGRLGPVDVDDAAATLVRYDSGAIGYLEGTRFATGRKNHNRFEINGAKGSLVWDLERMNELQLYLEEGPNSGFRNILVTDAKHPYTGNWWPPGHIIGYEHSFTHTVNDFLRALVDGTSPRPNFEDGWRNQRVLDAIERSAAQGKWVSVTDEDRG
jgi:predicted dehydrogenase